jgi:hypothetical protein
VYLCVHLFVAAVPQLCLYMRLCHIKTHLCRLTKPNCAAPPQDRDRGNMDFDTSLLYNFLNSIDLNNFPLKPEDFTAYTPATHGTILTRCSAPTNGVTYIQCKITRGEPESPANLTEGPRHLCGGLRQPHGGSL